MSSQSQQDPIQHLLNAIHEAQLDEFPSPQEIDILGLLQALNFRVESLQQSMTSTNTRLDQIVQMIKRIETDHSVQSAPMMVPPVAHTVAPHYFKSSNRSIQTSSSPDTSITQDEE